ncbi:MAG: hypothetical protein AAB588_04790 [Patescibacteria group bacterium]
MDISQKRPEKIVMGVIVVVLVALLIFIGVSAWRLRNMPRVDPNTYQVVFLSNNLQYFGHLQNIGTRHPTLSDIYYVQSQNTQGQAPADQKFVLIKLGNEMFGPEDVMYLSKDTILFWQNLRPDSRIVKGIMQEKAQRANPQPPVVQPSPLPLAPAANVAPAPVPAAAPAPVKKP